MDNLKTKVSEALKTAALNESAKHYLLQNPTLFKLLLKGARRYIGGENLEDTILTVKKLNANNFPTSVEFMGESVGSINEANEVTQEFLKIINTIKKEKLNSIVSLDLSHIGLAIDIRLAFENLKSLAEATKDSGIEIIISAEGIDRTDKIIETFCKISPDYPNVGITIQAYLHRTSKDLEHILQETQGKIRIVKGAFATPEEYALKRGNKLDENYISLIETLLSSKRRCSIATHHDKIQDRIKNLVNKHDIPKTNYEFEMLYGIREDLLKTLQQEGY
ncbi:MAG TPA: proline dehydrogenase family protein, partial [Chitinophagaceae bacterium]|nr:proline dehydrogenase family protein [Chitinophagaceae bacterium]